MEAEIRMKMNYDAQSVNLGEKPYINVLPNHPYEAYRRLDSDTVIQVKKTERVPLPQIRQLILMYTLKQKQNSPLDESDLLREKLILSNLNSQNQELHDISEKWLLEAERLSKLNDVFEEYKNQRQMLISRAVMKTKHNVHQSAQKFKNSVKMIETQKTTKINAFYNRVNSSSRSGSGSGYKNVQNKNYPMSASGRLQPHEQDELGSIQKEANMKIVNHIKSQADQNNRYQSEEQERLYGLRHLSCYLNEFEKALIFIVSARNIANLNQQLGTINQNYNKTFAEKIQYYINTIKYFNDQLLNHIFQWHMHIKHNKSYDSRLNQFRGRSDVLEKELSEQLYYFIPKILANLQNDREQLKGLVDFFTNNFESYLGTYYSIKQVEMYHSKQSHVQQIIENERQSLNNHLKKNFGMMVPYRKSHQYEELAGIAISKDKPYLKTLLQQKIGYLQQAIAYVNYQHSKLYKQACENSPGVTAKIRRKLQEFQLMGGKYPELRVHLQQSCQRLLEIVNH